MSNLVVTIPDKASFYSLYSDGLLVRKTYVREMESTLIEYAHDAAVLLYYTYPTHREACLVRNSFSPSSVILPGLSKKVSLLFSVNASRVDKTRRVFGFLNSNYKNAFSFNDGFYIRLSFLIRQRGKINYMALKEIAGKELIC